ncbi:hypothetical protein PsorP6_017102 [Peronosclerospora sorghi]|uniref:Uncharacterized protein n=1 Tax=Peronosclerospora sorghi TaxID=230839 RepID=A0ACC0WCP4_9STRA|nr:hypothetical protein PsorP6_017102 [Peronosclerospora sorghi]
MDKRSASSASYFAVPAPSCRLLLRVYAARGLRNVTSHGTYCKLYVTSAEMVHGSGSRSFSRRPPKLTSSSSARGFGRESDMNDKMRVLKTQVQKGKRHNPVWNENFDIPVLDLNEEVLSIRVKSATLMSPAIGACSISLRHLTGLSTGTIDRWVDLKRGKRDAGRIRLQLKLVDASTSTLEETDPTTRDDKSDSFLSLPEKETMDEIVARMKKTSRRGHKYHRLARHFDGRPVTNSVLGSSSGSNRSASDKDEAGQRTLRKSHDYCASATSNESIDDSECASEVSISPVGSPRSDEASSRDSFASSALDRLTATDRSSSHPVKAAAVGLDASAARVGAKRKSELEKSRRSRLTNASSHQSGREEDFDIDAYLDEYDHSIVRKTSNRSKFSDISSIEDSRASSRMDFDDDYDDWESRPTGKKSQLNTSASIVRSSAESSMLELRESTQFSFNDVSDSDSEDDEAKSDKAREQQRQQWQTQQRKMQLARIKETSHFLSDDELNDDFESENEDSVPAVLGTDTSKSRLTLTLATLLNRESMNVLMDEEDDDEGAGTYKMSMDFIPILEASSPASVDLVDCALRRSSLG